MRPRMSISVAGQVAAASLSLAIFAMDMRAQQRATSSPAGQWVLQETVIERDDPTPEPRVQNPSTWVSINNGSAAATFSYRIQYREETHQFGFSTAWTPPPGRLAPGSDVAMSLTVTLDQPGIITSLRGQPAKELGKVGRLQAGIAFPDARWSTKYASDLGFVNVGYKIAGRSSQSTKSAPVPSPTGAGWNRSGPPAKMDIHVSSWDGGARRTYRYKYVWQDGESTGGSTVLPSSGGCRLAPSTRYACSEGPAAGRTTNRCEVSVDSFDAASGRFVGQLAWPSLGAIHKVEGTCSGAGVQFTETNTIKKGRAVLGCRYDLTYQRDELVGSYAMCDGGGKGVFGVTLAAAPPQVEAPVAPTCMLSKATDYACKESNTSGPGTVCTLRLETLSADGAFAGRIAWTALESVHRIEGTCSAKSLTFTETSYLTKGRATLGCTYDLSLANGSLAGSYAKCNAGPSGSFLVLMK